MMHSYRIVARVLAWIGIIGIIILSVVPANDRPTPGEGWFGELFGHINEHVAAFGLVAGAFAIGYRFSLLRLLALAFFYCGGIELLQIPLPTRHARVSDFIIDFAASAVTIVLVQVGGLLQCRIGSNARRHAGSGASRYRQATGVTLHKQSQISDQRAGRDICD